MVIHTFAATHFRNYKELRVTFSDDINFIVGDNGQGKTNLVEAIYFVNHLESFRTHRPKKLIHFEQPLSCLQAHFNCSDWVHQSRIELSRLGRKVWLNHSPVSRLSEYITRFYAVVFNPDSLHAFRYHPTVKRTFFNRFLSFLSGVFLREMRDFRSVHSQKNQLLKSREKSSLMDWNALFVEKSCGIICARQKMVERVNQILPDVFSCISGHKECLTLRYVPSLSADVLKSTEVLAKAAEQEFKLGYALYGPHRDEFGFQLGKTQLDDFFSQGEYRIALLALKLTANAIVVEQLGFYPILILDDLFSELDAKVRSNLRAYLSGLNNQVFITSTDQGEARDYPHAQIMEICGGRVVNN